MGKLLNSLKNRIIEEYKSVGYKLTLIKSNLNQRGHECSVQSVMRTIKHYEKFGNVDKKPYVRDSSKLSEIALCHLHEHMLKRDETTTKQLQVHILWKIILKKQKSTKFVDKYINKV